MRWFAYGVPINTKALKTLGSSVDQSQPVCLASSEFELRNTGLISTLGRVSCSDCTAIKVHFAIDEVVVREWSWVATRLKWSSNRLEKIKVLLMIVI